MLHAVIRHYKPARLIEIGGGVPSYCTSQAISMNRRDTGLNGHITCIEPDPIDMIKDLANTTVPVLACLFGEHGIQLKQGGRTIRCVF